MSFHQSQMTRQVLYLLTEIKPRQRMLKSKCDLLQLHRHLLARLDEYLDCPEQLKDITYPEFFKWWHKTTSDENKKGEVQSAQGDVPHLGCRTTNDDFAV